MSSRRSLRQWTIRSLAAATLFAPSAEAVAQSLDSPRQENRQPEKAGAADTRTAEQRVTELSREVEELKALVHQLQAQVSQLLASPPATSNVVSAVPPAQAATATAPTPTASADAAPANTAAVPPGLGEDLLHGLTISAALDGYYEYNTNDPIGRANTLRAYDVSSNSFSLNQFDLILESAPDPASGKRAGMRVDLQYGQATATLQGSTANELRPEIYRALFQAYGTYVFPVGRGISVDFGKWASSLGLEGNFTKDQQNYSRSFWYDYLPFYHTGIRVKYVVDDELAVNWWITNGTQQTEDFNNEKDQLFGIVLTPTPALSWTLNYYRGQEHPDVLYLRNAGPGAQNLPNQQGTYFLPIANAPDGTLQIIDSYVSWQALPALTVAAEADYVQERQYSYSMQQHVTGGALYGAYQLTPKVAFAARVEYLADRGGLFSGTTQYLKEGTLTLDYRPTDGFLMRGELRRDQSNQHFFLSDRAALLESSQQTVGLGLVWWFGQKKGAW